MQKNSLLGSFKLNARKFVCFLGLNTSRITYNKTFTCLVFATLLEISPTNALIADNSKAKVFNHQWRTYSTSDFHKTVLPLFLQTAYICLYLPISAYICEKAYVCLFNSLVTRVVHLEVTEDLTTTICVTAIRRFIARRGQLQLFFSEKGSNCLGARKQIRRQPLKPDHEFIRQKLMNQSVEWRLNAPSAPHFSGVWERLVHIVKRALILNLGSVKLTWDTFSTIVTRTESLVNVRPLTPVRSDFKDENPLTPNHFLIGRAFSNVPA